MLGAGLDAVQYAKKNLLGEFTPELEKPFYRTNDFQVLFRDLQHAGALEVPKKFAEYVSRWHGSKCDQVSSDPTTNRSYTFECLNYTLFGTQEAISLLLILPN